MPNINDYKLAESFKILLVGSNGIGKSIAASSFHEAGPVHIDDFDGRMEPVARHFQGKTNNISFESYGSDDFKKYMNWLQRIQDQSVPLSPSGKPFKTWITDSITSLSMGIVIYQLTMSGAIKTGPGGVPNTSWSEINGETVQISRFLEVMKIINENHKINIIVTAHPIIKTEIDGSGGGKNKKSEALVAYGPKIGSIIPGYFNEIYRLTAKKSGINDPYKRVALTNMLSADGDIMAKSALGLPDEMDITDGLYQAIMKNVKK